MRSENEKGEGQRWAAQRVLKARRLRPDRVQSPMPVRWVVFAVLIVIVGGIVAFGMGYADADALPVDWLRG